jgi:hypothetical protein
MGEMQINLTNAIAVPGMDASVAMRETSQALYGVPGAGPTGARSRFQWSQSGVRDDLGLRHWKLSS